jgi:hypothetical protein
MHQLSLGFLDACRWLANDSNIILTEYKPPSPTPSLTFDASRYERFFERPWLSDAARRFLFAERMIDERVVRWCRLTSWQDRKGVNWLQIPYYDCEGRLIGIQNRNLNPRDDLPRFRFPQGSRCTIYNLPILRLLRPDDDLYITEGCSDCWAMLSSGRKAIAIPSATLMKDDDVTTITRHLTPHTRLHMFPDNDEPGERLFLQLKSRLPDLQHHHLPLGCKDFAEYYVLTKKKGVSS